MFLLCFQSCQSIFDSPECDVSSDDNIDLHGSFDFVTKAISDLRGKMENIAKAIAELSEESKKTPVFRLHIHINCKTV